MKLAIIVAMEKEIELLIKYYEAKEISSTHHIYQSQKYPNIYISRSGIGKVNAAMNTQYLIDTYEPNYIINTGCAGSLVDSVHIMDTVVAKFSTYHDFLPLRIMKQNTPDEGKIESNIDMLNQAEHVLRERKEPYHIGTICSGDCFVTNELQRDQIYEQTQALCVEMESASIAHVSKKNNIPFISIRTMSDFSDGAEEKEQEAANVASQIVIEIVKNYEKTI